MEKKITETENIARFINQRSYYRPSDNTVRWNAFMPSREMEVSVYRVDGLNDNEINELGEEFVVKIMKKELLGRAEIFASSIIEMKLGIEPDIKIHPLHANIIGWPDEKSEHKLLAIELASKSKLILKN